MSYLNIVHDIHLPPADISHCIRLIFSFASPLCSTLFILSMTFDRCYSILRPHKAASFNTVKRAKITIVTITVLSLLYNIPQYFLSKSTGANCVPYAKGGQYVYGQLYYWISFLINFGGPFLLLLIMNCFIINTLRKRFSSIKKQNTANEMTQGQPQGQSQGEGQIQSSAVKTSEIQIYAILLLVTFSFLILTIPGTVILLYMIRVDVGNSPQAYAEFYLLQNIGEKMYYTIGGINFFLYVISGQKFRKDLLGLFKCKKVKARDISTTLDTNTTTVNIEGKWSLRTRFEFVSNWFK